MLDEVKTNVGRSNRELERIARTAENLAVRVEHRHGKEVRYAAGPVDDNGNVYWPDIMLCTQDIFNVADVVKISGPSVRFTMENGHGQYHTLGYYNDTYLVLQKVSSSIEHPLLVVEDPGAEKLQR